MQVCQAAPGRGEGDEILARGHERQTRQGLLEVRRVATAVLRVMQEAARFQCSVVETNRREENSSVPDSAKKVSTSALVTKRSGS